MIMKYILSKMTNSVSYRNYRYVGDRNATQNQSLLPIPADTVIIRGGADRPSQKGGIGNAETDLNGNLLWTPRGVVTTLSDEDYDRVKEHWLFKKHLEAGFLAVLDDDISHDHKKITRIADDMAGQDPGAQLTKDTIAQRIKVKTPTKELDAEGV
jgi:hypothetical protein